MSEYTLHNPILAIENSDGELEPVGFCQEIKAIEEEKNTMDDLVSTNQLTCEFTIKPHKMSRKKFIKLLMAKGIQRNGANEIAKYFNKKNNRYSLLDLMWF